MSLRAPGLTRWCLILGCLPIWLCACGTDAAGPPTDPPDDVEPVPDRPAYTEHLAPILARACQGCHATATTAGDPRNCVRTDRWDSAADPGQLCSDPTTGGTIFGVRDAGPRIVENIVSRRMPLVGPPLADHEIQMFQRWADAGFPRRAVNQPPVIELLTPPAGGAMVCVTSCRYEISYAAHDPDGDSLRWSLAWSGGGKTGVFAPRVEGGAGSVMIDATALPPGTYTLTATLDDGTDTVTVTAAGTLTVPAGHNAAPTVAVSEPNGGESYDDGEPIMIRWMGSDPDDATLTYDIVAVGADTITIDTMTAPVGEAQLLWTPPRVATPTPLRISIVARDSMDREAPSADHSDAEFVISPPAVAVSFAQQVIPIFNARCSGCHGASAEMPLTPETAYRSIVGVPAPQWPCESYQLVNPGLPDKSYLLFKLQGVGECFTGSRMPRGEAPLSAAELQTIRDWVAAGAPNN